MRTVAPRCVTGEGSLFCARPDVAMKLLWSMRPSFGGTT